jgi:ribose transport system permease protein
MAMRSEGSKIVAQADSGALGVRSLRAQVRPRSLGARLRDADPRTYVVYLIFLGILGFFAITLNDEGFLTSENLLNILRQAAPIAVMASAFVFVLSAGEIDLSIGAVVGLAAVITAMVLRDVGLIAGIAAGLGVGALVGLINGVVVAALRVPSFLVTLATMGVAMGLSRTVSDLKSIAVTNFDYTDLFGSGDVGPIPGLVVWMLVIVAAGHLLLRHRAFGAHVLAVGDDREAARVAGVPVGRVKLAVLVLSGAAAGLAGMLYAGRLESARYTLGEADLLIVIAAVILGGTRLFGGYGSVIGALIGSVIIVMLNNGLILMGLSVNEQLIAQGGILLLAVVLTLRERPR